MLTYEQALELVLERGVPLPATWVTLAEALGLVVAEPILAPEPVPPFTNSAMDGFALRALDGASVEPGQPLRLPVAGLIQAGQAEPVRLAPGTALRIMTGAPLPEGADTVVPLETVKAGPDWLELSAPVRAGAHVRLAGEDVPAGGQVLAAGAILRPAEIGVLAAIGCSRVPVRPRPRVAVLTTGNELVDAADRPGPGQIRDANLHSLCAQIQAAGGVPVPFPRVPDRPEALTGALAEALASTDLVLSNGGVSVGDFDYLKEVLAGLGAEPRFWRVAQKPGGPLGLWRLQGKPVFGIPGNPVAAMLMFEEYVRPALRQMMGYPCLHRPWRTGILAEPWAKREADGRIQWLRVVVRAGQVRLTGPQGSGLLSSMMLANALALVPAETVRLEVGAEVLLHCIDEPEDH